MMNVTTAGIALAQERIHVHGVDAHGKFAVKKTLSRIIQQSQLKLG